MMLSINIFLFLAIGGILNSRCYMNGVINPVRIRQSKHIKMEYSRLPEGIKPIAYDLFLYPNLKTETFLGKVIIDVDIKDDHKSIILHNNGLNIKKALIDDLDAVHKTDGKYEILQISLPNFDNLGTGKRKITIEFDGDLKNRYVGFYSSKYSNEKGTKT